jgi:hypothetical protein
MLIANTGQSLVVMNLRTGEQVQLPPGQRTSLADSKIQYIDDSFVLISMFNAGVLVAYTDAGAAYPGFPTTANPADSKRIPPVDADYAAAVVGAGFGKRVLFQGVADTYTAEAAAFNDALLDSILAANTDTAITIVFTQPYYFRAQHTARSSVVLEGSGKAAPIKFVGATSNLTWFIWSRNSADSSQLNEEGQLIGCGMRNLYVMSDRSNRSNALYMLGVDFPYLDVEVFGFKGYSLRLGNCRVGDGPRILTYYCGYTDLTNGANNLPDILVDSPTAAWDESNLLTCSNIQSYYSFGPSIVLDGAYSNMLGSAALVVHQLPNANTSFETNFLTAFPTYNGSAAALGWDSSGNPRNEYAAMHVGAPSVANVSGRLWQANHAYFNFGLHLKKNVNGDPSDRNKIGQSRFIGGQTLYTILVEGSSDLFCAAAEITSAGPFAANVTCNATTDIITFSSVTAAAKCSIVPPTGTPIIFSGGTPPAGLAASQTYYVIKLSDTTFSVARTYALAVAGTALDFTDAGTSVVVTAGGIPLNVRDASTVVLDEKSEIDIGAIAAWHDETSTIRGMALTGNTWNLYPLARHEATEKVLFVARGVRLDAVGDTPMIKTFGGRRYITTKITAVQKSLVSCAGATVGIFSGAAGAGTALVSSAAMTGLDTANKFKDLTSAATTAVVTGSDGTPPNVYVSVAGAAGAVADVWVWGYPAD